MGKEKRMEDTGREGGEKKTVQAHGPVGIKDKGKQYAVSRT